LSTTVLRHQAQRAPLAVALHFCCDLLDLRRNVYWSKSKVSRWNFACLILCCFVLVLVHSKDGKYRSRGALLYVNRSGSRASVVMVLEMMNLIERKSRVDRKSILHCIRSFAADGELRHLFFFLNLLGLDRLDGHWLLAAHSLEDGDHHLVTSIKLLLDLLK